LRFRRVLVGLAILVLVSGIFLFAITTIRETRTSGGTSFSNGPVLGGGFGYSGITESYNTPPQIIVGTSGIADLMILTTPWRDFNSWICHHMPTPQLAPGYTWSCSGFGGGSNFNLTILNSYLQTNQSRIAYSQTIVDQNVSLTSLAYHVTSWTDVTIVLVQLGSGWTRDYWQTTVTNQTTTYPLIGYTEKSGTIFTLPNISIGLIAAGVASLVTLSVTQHRLHPSSRSAPYKGSAAGKCPGCGGENLFFAEKCRHCGRTLHETPTMVEAR
jgi:hypothetical protein